MIPPVPSYDDLVARYGLRNRGDAYEALGRTTVQADSLCAALFVSEQTNEELRLELAELRHDFSRLQAELAGYQACGERGVA